MRYHMTVDHLTCVKHHTAMTVEVDALLLHSKCNILPCPFSCNKWRQFILLILQTIWTQIRLLQKFDQCCRDKRVHLNICSRHNKQTTLLIWIHHVSEQINSGLQIRVCTRKLFFLLLNQNICCGYSKEPSHWNGSFEHPKHMYELKGKEINVILSAQTILIWTYVYWIYTVFKRT